MDQDAQKTSQSKTLTKAPSSRQNKISIAILLGVAAIAAALFAVYTAYQAQQVASLQQGSSQKVSSQLIQLQEKQQKDLETTAQSLSQNDSQIQSLSQQIQTLNSTSLSQDTKWQLLKARYYLELAQINTYWTTDYKTSLALLSESDKVLIEVQGMDLSALRQALAKEMSELKTIPVLDVVGLLSQLNALQAQVSNLSMVKGMESKDTPETSSSSNWRSHWQRSLRTLEKLVVIRKDNTEMKQLSPQLEAAVKESIRLSLQQAEWAVLHNKEEVFQMALQEAITQLRLRFNLSSAEGLIEQLTQLQKTAFLATKPAQGVALSLLNRLLQSGITPSEKTQ